jgi:type II secretory pathway pseudopilin PulG
MGICERDGRRAEAGFAYLLLLVAIAVVGIVAASTVSIGARLARRDAELQLLVVGAEFERALQSYAAAMPQGQSTRPTALADLLLDPRYPGVRRHLRKLYLDPMTGREGWGIVRDPQGGIVGVYSLDSSQPIKRAGFDMQYARFEGAKSYADWTFGDALALTMSKRVAVAPR